MPTTSSSLNSINISEVYFTLISLDPNKAFGIDGISPALLKYCAACSLNKAFSLFYSLTVSITV